MLWLKFLQFINLNLHTYVKSIIFIRHTIKFCEVLYSVVMGIFLHIIWATVVYWNIFFHPCTLLSILDAKVHVSCMDKRRMGLIFPTIVSLCLFIGGIESIDAERCQWAVIFFFLIPVIML